jgi:hypothetical protein
MSERRDEEELAGAALDEFMRSVDWEAWRAPAPPASFAQRVVLHAEAGDLRSRAPQRLLAPAPQRLLAPARRARALAVLCGMALAAAALAVVLVFGLARPGAGVAGERVATGRLELAIGTRAVAVLEAGAVLRWRGDRVTQSAGEVFYRVEPGAAFSVHTPSGSVEVLGTCFRVRVETAPGSSVAAATVRVDEGRVRASAASGSLELRAGEAARLDPDGVRRLEADDGDATETPIPAPASDAEAALEESRLRERLRQLSTRRRDLEQDIEAATAQLGRARGALPERHPYDLTPEDWGELARTGAVKFRLPCDSDEFRATPELLDRLGLAPEDGPVIERAYAGSRARVRRTLRPLCEAMLGQAAADLLPREACTMAIMEAARRRDRAASDEAMRQVGEIRAGLRPAPAPGEPLHPLLELLLVLTAEPALFEAELTQSLGPEDAKRLTFSDEMCRERLTFEGPGPREE